MGGGLPPRALRESSKHPIGIAERPISENRADGRLRRPARGNTITLTFKLTLREDALATYVISDVHGHLRAFERALEMAAPGSQDAIFVLGDMVDRGPDPLGVITRARALPNACVLMGNHESMLLDTVLEGDDLDMMSWHLNGGYVTSSQLDALPRDVYVDIMDWLSALPAFAVVETDDARPSAGPGDRRVNVLCHAGVDAARLRDSLSRRGAGPDALGGYAQATPDDLLAAMGEQDLGDLLWIREGFWSRLTGLVGADGRGPVVVAGHTPSAILGRYARQMCGAGVDGDLRGVMVEVGPTADTGGVADRICIDCSAAKGHPYGRVGIMRLEDRRVWLADIEEGE